MMLANDTGSGGSIPACAGEADFCPLIIRRRTVYPRVCGGSFGNALRTLHHPGLSPRVRGKR